jgi:hypothetical protein
MQLHSNVLNGLNQHAQYAQYVQHAQHARHAQHAQHAQYAQYAQYAQMGLTILQFLVNRIKQDNTLVLNTTNDHNVAVKVFYMTGEAIDLLNLATHTHLHTLYDKFYEELFGMIDTRLSKRKKNPDPIRIHSNPFEALNIRHTFCADRIHRGSSVHRASPSVHRVSPSVHRASPSVHRASPSVHRASPSSVHIHPGSVSISPSDSGSVSSRKRKRESGGARSKKSSNKSKIRKSKTRKSNSRK